MKNYELTYLISPDLSEEKLENFSEQIKSFIREEAGTLEKTTEPSREKLGYPIKKKEGAFSITLNFHLQPEKLENLEKKLKSENQILRYIILTKKAPGKILRPRRQPQAGIGLAAKEALPKREEALKPIKRIIKPKKVELKEIDKKIEEILGE